ncbi:putative FAD dependent oxidoreductase [Seiridium unicorne]|uniref:FAD dependent oxidoreductase n=1 Tax=Seiridium unicorne TaxID=138068 RepID=A0ABR2ULW6_9PEZI
MASPQLLPGQAGLPVPNPTKAHWLKEPSEKLFGHRTTVDLPHSADVVIVGSGITGAIAAHTLKARRPELNVVMLEAREACWGATGRNGGHCQPAMYAAKPHIASFELRTYSYLKSLVEEYSIPCDWHSTSGVHAYFSASLFELAQEVVKSLGEKYPDLAANVAVVKKGDGGAPPYLLEGERKELTLEGLRVPTAEGAIVQWNAASLWPYKLVAFVLERLLAAGGFNLQTNTPVTGLQKVDPPSNLTSPVSPSVSDGEKKTVEHPTWIVHTDRGHITTRAVLLATNAYTSHLLPQFSDLIVPTRGQVAALKPPQEPSPGEPPLDIGHTFYILGESDTEDVHRDDYLIQRPPPAAELVLGGGRQLAKGYAVGVWDDSTMDEPVKWWLRGELTKALDLSLRDAPQSPVKHEHLSASAALDKQDLEPTHEWSGIMGYSRDAHPWVGPVPASVGGGDGLWVSAGYTGHGMPNAALCGKAAAELMTGAEEVDLPEEYEMSEERVGRARARDTVQEAEEKGALVFDLGAVRA